MTCGEVGINHRWDSSIETPDGLPWREGISPPHTERSEGAGGGKTCTRRPAIGRGGTDRAGQRCHRHQSVSAMARSASRSRADSFSVSDFS